MNCISYNIRDGGVDHLDSIMGMLSLLEPDIVVLQEGPLSGIDFTLNLLAGQMGLTNIYSAPYTNGRLSITLITRYKIRHARAYKNMTHAGFSAVLETDIGNVIVSGLHLDSSNETVRTRELYNVISEQNRTPSRIIMGDFNAISHNDYYDWNHAGWNMKYQKPVNANEIDYECLKSIELAGYLDTAVETLNNTIATVPITTDGDLRFTNLRLDYIFVSDTLRKKVKDYKVIDTVQTRRISDHLPVVVKVA